MNDLVALLDSERIVDVEVRTERGRTIRVPIWVVVIDGVPYAASVRGPSGRWYQALRAVGDGALHVQGHRVPIRARHVDTPAARQAMSDALTRKYATRPSLAKMLTTEVLGTILRLDLT